MPSAANDPFDLQRFVDAQDPIYPRVLTELRRGRKTTHWMWYVFPQMRGLGQSPMSDRYGISSEDEARAYLQHPVLGPRLRECVSIVNGMDGHSAHDIFGYPDDLKFHSCLTLFSSVAANDEVFSSALRKYFP
ncbi:MAG TPA: DUF1810 domain-containing protein [Bryobacteraceae bacterium]|nr:DUF1810 domain-containing protein [Bryobacteraceae bacterium]